MLLSKTRLFEYSRVSMVYLHRYRVHTGTERKSIATPTPQARVHAIELAHHISR